MHKLLQITDADVTELRKLGIKAANKARSVVEEAVRANRGGKLYPELSHRAGLCQKALANQDAFKRMVLIQEAIERKNNPGSHAGADTLVG